ncbi:MAG: hypothetical protein R3274_03260 [Desulfobacterales bacterium]|nr:hypothetical protein [Desulfobacterales bacterium]
MENDLPPSLFETDIIEHKDPEKKAVECICPKCGERHVLNFHWIGRGMPRKYCSLCKNAL